MKKHALEKALSSLFALPMEMQLQQTATPLAVVLSSRTSSLPQLMRLVEEVSNDMLSDTVGVPAVHTAATCESRNVSVPADAGCPMGFYCSAGHDYPCPRNTWNNLTDQVDSNACQQCPLRSSTESVGAAFIDDCQCEPSYYKDSSGSCLLCPSGTSCTVAGIVLENLPVRVGFFR